MLKFITILLLTFLSGTTFGQKDTTIATYSIGMNVFPKFSMPTDFGLSDFFSLPNHSPEQGMINNPKFTIQTGLSSRLMLSQKNHFFLLFSLGYLNNGYIAKNLNSGIYLIDNEGDINIDEPSWADISNISHYGFTSLSLGKSILSFSDKFHLTGLLGIQGQYLFSSSIYIEHHSESNRHHDYQYTYNKSDIIENYVVSLLAELGLDIQISNDFLLLSNIVFLYDINEAKLINNNERRYYSIGLKLGVFYNL